MFDTIAGRGVDTCILGMAQVDRSGSVNVSHIGGLIVGPGGFIDISQSSRHAVFCGTFTTRGLQVAASGGRLQILQEGTISKFVEKVDAITYSGPFATAEGRRATYVTERAVFELTPEGLELTEVAPGVSIDRDILPHMGFTPIIRSPRSMAAGLFAGDAAGESQGGPS
jgi:propionate CoA-transferase